MSKIITSRISGIVFLDIDGVLLPIDALEYVEALNVLKDPCAYLGMLIGRTPAAALGALKSWCLREQARCVMISSWRKIFPVAFIQSYMEGLGLWPDYFYPGDDWCAHATGLHSRTQKGTDIGCWLGDHLKFKRKHIVIDDHDLTLQELHGMTYRQIMPDPKIGLTAADLVGVTLKKRRRDRQ